MEKPVNKHLAPTLFALALVAASPAGAAERTVTLAVRNMDCAECPFVVRKSIEAVPGVAKVVVSFKDKTAVVSYDDSKANVKALTDATANAGYPSAPKG
jgi:mercuric ion binding protein